MMIDVWIGKGIGGEGCVIHRERRYSPGEWDLAPVGDQTLIPPPPCNMGVNVDLDPIFFDDHEHDTPRRQISLSELPLTRGVFRKLSRGGGSAHVGA